MDTLHQAWLKRFEELESHLNSLDAATGDGDHGATMLRGLQAVVADSSLPAKAFRNAAGGASGSLFSILVGAIDAVANGRNNLPEALATAAEKIQQMGMAVEGDKTMLDALIPASRENDIHTAVDAARGGCEMTLNMPAKRGRAKYVEGAGVGCIDAGATSVVVLLEVYEQLCSADAQSSPS